MNQYVEQHGERREQETTALLVDVGVAMAQCLSVADAVHFLTLKGINKPTIYRVLCSSRGIPDRRGLPEEWIAKQSATRKQ